MKVSKHEWLAAFGYTAALTLGLLLAVWASGCGSNIPIDPDCERLLDAHADERAEFACDLPPSATCDAEFEAGFNEGYGEGFAAASDLCDLDASYDEGFEDGADSVIYEVDDEEEDECDRDVPRGHLAKHCRGRRGK